jgi:Domain of unknown function (DUF4169)
MADIINLRRARKDKARTDREMVAAESRLKFGQSKSERKLKDALQQQADQNLDAHKRNTD